VRPNPCLAYQVTPLTALDAVKTRERNRRQRAVPNRIESERTGSSEGVMPGGETGSIPGSSTSFPLVTALRYAKVSRRPHKRSTSGGKVGHRGPAIDRGLMVGPGLASRRSDLAPGSGGAPTRSQDRCWGSGLGKKSSQRAWARRSASPRQRPRNRSSLFSTNACAASLWSSVRPVWMWCVTSRSMHSSRLPWTARLRFSFM
jgi:hypothetical protein